MSNTCPYTNTGSAAMAFRQEIFEAVDPAFTIANRIMNKMDWSEIADITEDSEINKDYIKRRASKYYHSFDNLSEEIKDKVIERIWNRLKRESPAKEETTSGMSREELRQKIEDYFNKSGQIKFSIQDVAEDLSVALSNEEPEIKEADADSFSSMTAKILGGAVLGPLGMMAADKFIKPDTPKKAAKYIAGLIKKRLGSKNKDEEQKKS